MVVPAGLVVVPVGLVVVPVDLVYLYKKYNLVMLSL